MRLSPRRESPGTGMGQHLSLERVLWADKKIFIKSDKTDLVEVLQMGRARDPVMATIARNIWLLTAEFTIHFPCQYSAGTVNTTADLLCRWSNSAYGVAKLH